MVRRVTRNTTATPQPAAAAKPAAKPETTAKSPDKLTISPQTRALVAGMWKKVCAEADAKEKKSTLAVRAETKPADKVPEPVTLAVQSGTSNKFYALAVEGTTVKKHWGKIGTDGKVSEKTFDTIEDARKHYMDTLRAKLKKGYAKVDPQTIGLAPSGVSSNDEPGSTTVDSLTAFVALSKDEREAILHDDDYEAFGIESTGEVWINELSGAQAAFAEKLKDALDSGTGGFEVHDDEYLTAGDPRFEVSICTASNGDVLGGRIRVYQDGCSIPDDYWDNEDAYDDAKLMERADDEDVSWQAHGTWAATEDGAVEPIYEPESMSWSGH